MMKRRSFLGLLAATGFVGSQARASEPEIFAEEGLAIRGFDPVGYFTAGEAVRGTTDHAVVWRGAEWRFASAESRAMFEMDPMRYAPQYGGYCAYAVSQGYVAPIDPEAWSIVDDKLYLNFSKRVRRLWSRDIPGHIAQGDANWPGVLA